jgi:hypothetical protein
MGGKGNLVHDYSGKVKVSGPLLPQCERLLRLDFGSGMRGFELNVVCQK